MIATKIPQSDEKDFSILYHLTCIDAAEKILNSGEIYGNDTEHHANFSALTERPDIAKCKEVCLQFRWSGSQAMYFGDPFGRGEPSSNGLNKPILYHIFTNNYLKEGEPLRKQKYWQSNLYPGSSGLVFEGIKKIHLQPAPIPWRPCRLFFWNYAEKLHNYKEIKKIHHRIEVLQKLAKNKINSTFYVPVIS